jgi:hypothetical protein
MLWNLATKEAKTGEITMVSTMMDGTRLQRLFRTVTTMTTVELAVDGLVEVGTTETATATTQVVVMTEAVAMMAEVEVMVEAVEMGAEGAVEIELIQKRHCAFSNSF